MSDTNQTVKLGKGTNGTGYASVSLSRYEEWHNCSRDIIDAGSTYTMLASMEATVKASEIDLGLADF